MPPKVIKSNHDYQVALGRIELLMDAAPNTPEGDELELLTTLVEIYEKKEFPIDLPDPIEAIRFRMEQAGLKQQDLVTYVGSRSKVSEVLSGRRSLSLKMIRALHSGLGIPAEVLLREPGATVPDTLSNIEFDKFPLVEMAKRNWLGEVSRSAAELKERAEEVVRAFLNSSEGCYCLAPRQHVRSGSNMNRYALLAWCVRVAALAGKQRVPSYCPGTISAEFMGQLLNLSYLDTGPRLAMEFLTKGGIHMVVLRHLPQTHLDGIAMMLPSGNPVVALTVRHDRLDNFWFTLFHELGHIALHFDREKDACFVDDLDSAPEGRECEADEFAQNHLIPYEIWEKAPARVEQTPRSVQALAESLRVHPAVIAGRIRREQKNYRLLTQLVGLNGVRSHFPNAEEGDIGGSVHAG